MSAIGPVGYLLRPNNDGGFDGSSLYLVVEAFQDPDGTIWLTVDRLYRLTHADLWRRAHADNFMDSAQFSGLVAQGYAAVPLPVVSEAYSGYMLREFAGGLIS